MAEPYISIVGNLGSGKTSVAHKLSDYFGWLLISEPKQNPFLDDFYRDMERWAFHNQIYFLIEFLRVQKMITQYTGPICQDRNIFECYEVFVKALAESGRLSRHEFETCKLLYNLCVSELQKPTLMIFLVATEANVLTRVRKRGRPEDSYVTGAYLATLKSRYDAWLSSFDLCPYISIDVDTVDLLYNTDHFQRLCTKIISIVGKKG